MGNKISRRRADVDERYTQPQGLQEHKEGDYRRLRRLILNGQLAPCFPGAEENALDLDECPICFLFYPSLNRSRCCSKPICTECYLQIKSSGFGRSTHCPFCKTSSYMVEYRGAKTLEEKSFEQAEEQKVIEAKIRIRQEELRGEEEQVLRLEEDTQAEELDVLSAREQGLHLFNAPTPDIRHLQICQPEDPFEHETNQMSAHREYVQRSFCSSDRYDDLDMEDIMYMEAIWLSIQDQGQVHEDFAVAQQIPTSNASSEAELRSMAGERRLIAGGLAEAIAALAERESSTVENRTGSEAVIRNHTDMTSLRYRDLDTRPMAVGKQVATREKGLSGEWKCPKQLNGWIDASQGSEGRDFYDWVSSQSSEAAAVGTSFSFNIPSASDLASESPDLDPIQSSHNLGEACLSSTSASVMPETFEEQIMLAMALSLAESQAQARRR